MRGQKTCPLYNKYLFNMWRVSSDVSTQRRHWQPLQPMMWMRWCVVWRLTTPPGPTSTTLFEQRCGFFYVPQEQDMCQCCETDLWFSSLSEKTRKSNHLQMSLQRQHFLLSYLKTLSVGPVGIRTRYLPFTRTTLLPYWGNHVAGATTKTEEVTLSIKPSFFTYSRVFSTLGCRA